MLKIYVIYLVISAKNAIFAPLLSLTSACKWDRRDRNGQYTCPRMQCDGRFWARLLEVAQASGKGQSSILSNTFLNKTN